MKAAVYRQYGPPEVVHLEEVEKPVPRDNEVLVRVVATPVTAGDWRVRTLNVPTGFGPIVRLLFGISSPRNAILGTELAGEIEAVGKGVTRFRVGDAVLAQLGFKMGSHAQYRCVPENGAIVRKPATLSFEEAAALPFGATTALYFFRQGKLGKGDRILINGASGAVGTAAVQLAKHFGAHVTAVCSAANANLIKSLGADAVIDYAKEDFTQNGKTYDVIMDNVGNSSLSRCRASLKDGGRLLLAVAGIPEMLQAVFSRKVKIVAGSANERAEDLEFLAKLAETGELKVVIDKTFSFEQIVEAHRLVETGHKKGNVVVRVRESAPDREAQSA